MCKVEKKVWGVCPEDEVSTADGARREDQDKKGKKEKESVFGCCLEPWRHLRGGWQGSGRQASDSMQNKRQDAVAGQRNAMMDDG